MTLSAVLLLGKPIRLQFSDILRDIYCNAMCVRTSCSTKISKLTVIKDAVQSLGYKEIRMDQFQNFLNTWCDHKIVDSAQPIYRSIVTRPFSLLVLVRAGSGHETTADFVVGHANQV